jgi:hypothetical protein
MKKTRNTYKILVERLQGKRLLGGLGPSVRIIQLKSDLIKCRI